MLALMRDLMAIVPNPRPVAPPGMAVPAGQMLGWLKWVGPVSGVVGLGICASMMMYLGESAILRRTTAYFARDVLPNHVPAGP